VIEIEHPKIGRMHALGIPAKLSETPATVRRPAPLLGQHSLEILTEAGFGAAEIENWIARHIVERAAPGSAGGDPAGNESTPGSTRAGPITDAVTPDGPRANAPISADMPRTERGQGAG
jgi:CoA-transferase family III